MSSNTATYIHAGAGQLRAMGAVMSMTIPGIGKPINFLPLQDQSLSMQGGQLQGGIAMEMDPDSARALQQKPSAKAAPRPTSSVNPRHKLDFNRFAALKKLANNPIHVAAQKRYAALVARHAPAKPAVTVPKVQTMQISSLNISPKQKGPQNIFNRAARAGLRVATAVATGVDPTTAMILAAVPRPRPMRHMFPTPAPV